MQTLSKGDAKRWCQSQGARFDEQGFPKPKERSKTFEIPEDAGRRVALVAKHLKRFQLTGKVLVWYDDWGAWPSAQRMHIFERFLASYGEKRPLAEIPAFLFSQGEHEDVVSFVTLGVLFLWDVRVVGMKARRLAFYSHDEVGWIGK